MFQLKTYSSVLGKSTSKLASVLLVLLSFSCNKNVVEPQEIVAADISFNVNWQYVSKTSTTPKSVTVWLYPRKGSVDVDGVSNWIYGHPLHLTVPTGVTVSISLEEGVYDLIAYNAEDLSNIKTENYSDYYKHKGVLPVIQGSTNTLPQADILHNLTGNSVRSLEVKAGVPLTVTLNPKTVTKTYNVNINVKSASEIKQGTATLMGIASFVNFYNGEMSSEDNKNVIFPITTQNRSKAESDLLNCYMVGTAYVLGTATFPEVKNELNVKIEYIDQTLPAVQLPTIDLTEDIKTNPNVNLDVNVTVDVTKENPDIKIEVIPYNIVDGEDIVVEPS